MQRSFITVGLFALWLSMLSVQAQPLAGRYIGVDAGHGSPCGGSYPSCGATGPNGLEERYLTWDTAVALKGYLEASGASVYMARASREENPTVSLRAQRFNSAGVDVAVSIHYDGQSSSYNYTEAFVYCGRCDTNSARLASDLVERQAQMAYRQKHPGPATGCCICATPPHLCSQPAVGTGALGVLATTAPSALAEISNLQNASEADRLLSADYVDDIAWHLYAGICDYYGVTPVPRVGAPSVTLTTKQISPTSVLQNQAFSVTTTLRVDSATASHAGISISFPSLTTPGRTTNGYSSPQGTVTRDFVSAGAAEYYLDGAVHSMSCRNNTCINKNHFLAEADWSNVSPGSTKTFNLTVTPAVTGSFKVRIRAWVTTGGASGYSNYSGDPSSGTVDQQNYWVYEDTVNVSSPTTRIIRLAGDLAFGNVTVGGTATRTLTIYNDGNATLNVSGIAYPSGFSGAWSGSIAPGGSKAVSVTFAPSSATTYGGTITVSSDKTSGGNTISCSGAGASSGTRIIRLSGDLSFGTVTVGQTGTRPLTIHNDGNATLTVSSITYPSGFTGDWSGGAIGAGSSKVINVTFAPTAGTTYSGTITVNSDKTSGTNTISCSGTGTVASQAVYDSVLKAPKCASVASTCDSGSLLMGRAGLGPEPNAPNTIASSCSDGASGVYQSDESNERLNISSTDGTPFAPGKAVRIEATVWAYDSSDVLDIYYTADVQNPSWLWIATFGIGGSGSQTLATTYTIPSGSALHAVRANFRYQGSPSSCTSGPYDDHDDLVFAVNNASPGPQTLTVNRSGGGTVTSNPSGINCGSTCSATFPYNSQVTLTVSAATGWNFSGWSGACNGTATQCTVTMSQARTVIATFSSTASPDPHGFIEVTGATAQVHDLGVGPDGSVYVLYGTTNPKTLHVVKSTDGAKTWQSPTDLPNSTYTNSDFQLAVDPAGVLHVVWYGSSDDQVYYARSTDGGASFSSPLGVRTGNYFDGYRTDNGVDPAVGSDGAGNVYVAFGAYTTNSSGTFLGYNVWVSRSTNGGSSFAPEFPINAISSTQKKPRKVRATASYLYVLFMDETNDDLYSHRRAVGASTGTTGRVNGTSGEVQYGGDLAVGPNDSILYAVFSDTTSDYEGNITFTKSTDGGLSWSGAVTVNDSTNRQQYHPMVGVDSAGRLHAGWTDGRSNGRTQAYYAYSENGGTTFSPNVNVSAPMTDLKFTQTHLVVHDASSSVYISATREITQVMVARLSTTPPQQQPPAAPTGLNATAVSTTRVELTWATVTDADVYQIERKSAGGTFTQIGTTASNTYADTSAAASTSYLYRVRASNEAGTSPSSAADLATTIVFTDPTLAGIRVKSVHIMQLRTAVDALRALAGLPAATFTNSALPGTRIRAQDLAELRTYIDEARGALGLPVSGYTDASLAGQRIKAVHVEQLRERSR